MSEQPRDPAAQIGVSMWLDLASCFEDVMDLNEVPQEDRYRVFLGFVGACVGYMSASIGPALSCEILDACKGSIHKLPRATLHEVKK